MADLIGYEAGSLGIPSLNRAETVRAPKAKDTRVATGPRDTRPSGWDTASKALLNSMDLATKGLNQATKAHLNETIAAGVDSKTRIKSASTDIASKYSKFKNNWYLNSSNITAENYNPDDYSEQKRLQSITEYTQQEIEAIKSNKTLTLDEQELVLNKLSSTIAPDLKSASEKIVTNYKKENITTLTRSLVNQQTMDLMQPDAKLKDIVSDGSELVKGLKANGKDVTPYEALKDSITELKLNDTVIEARFKEASEMYKDYETKGKVLPEGFMEYLSTVQNYNMANKKTKAATEKRINDAKSKAAKVRLEHNFSKFDITSKTVIDFSKITEGNFADISKNYIHGLENTTLVTDMRDAGYSDIKIEQKLKEYAKGKLVSDFMTFSKADAHSSHNLAILPKELLPAAKADLDSEWNVAIENSDIGSLEGLLDDNPEYIKPKFKTYIANDFQELTTIEDSEQWQTKAKEVLGFIGSIDKDVLKQTLTLDDKIRLALLNKHLTKDSYKDIMDKRSNEKSLSIPKGSIPEAVNELKATISVNDKSEFDMEVQIQLLTTGTVDIESLTDVFGLRPYGSNDLKVSHRFLDTFSSKEGIVDKALKSYFTQHRESYDDIVSTSFGDIPDNSEINIYRGMVVIDNEEGVRIGAIPVAELKQRIKDIYDIRDEQAAWDTANDKGLWSHIWSGLGDELDNQNPYRYAEKNYTSDLKNTK